MIYLARILQKFWKKSTYHHSIWTDIIFFFFHNQKSTAVQKQHLIFDAKATTRWRPYNYINKTQIECGFLFIFNEVFFLNKILTFPFSTLIHCSSIILIKYLITNTESTSTVVTPTKSAVKLWSVYHCFPFCRAAKPF